MLLALLSCVQVPRVQPADTAPPHKRQAVAQAAHHGVNEDQHTQRDVAGPSQSAGAPSPPTADNAALAQSGTTGTIIPVPPAPSAQCKGAAAAAVQPTPPAAAGSGGVAGAGPRSCATAADEAPTQAAGEAGGAATSLQGVLQSAAHAGAAPAAGAASFEPAAAAVSPTGGSAHAMLVAAPAAPARAATEATPAAVGCASPGGPSSSARPVPTAPSPSEGAVAVPSAAAAAAAAASRGVAPSSAEVSRLGDHALLDAGLALSIELQQELPNYQFEVTGSATVKLQRLLGQGGEADVYVAELCSYLLKDQQPPWGKKPQPQQVVVKIARPRIGDSQVAKLVSENERAA